MIIIAYLHGRNLVLIDHYRRKMLYLPSNFYDFPPHYSEVSNNEIESYLYEYAYRYDKVEIIKFEE